MKFLLSLVIALGAPAVAAAAPTLTLEAPMARVVIIPEARQDLAVTADPGLAIHPAPGGGARITGTSSWLEQNVPWLFGYRCAADGVTRWGQATALKDLPLLTVRAPLEAVIVSKGAVFGQAGPGRSLNLAATGCGTWRLGALSGGLTVTQTGPGQVIASRVDGVLTAKVDGSGTIVVGQGVVSAAKLVMKGSGRIDDRGSVGMLDAEMRGSGLITVRMVAGQAKVIYDGNGNVRWGRPKGRKFCSGLACY